MAIAVANLTSGSQIVSSTGVTASVTFTAGRLYILSFGNYRVGGFDAPTISGTGTWTQIIQQTNTHYLNFGITSYRFLCGSTVTGTVTATYGNTENFIEWVIDEITGMDTSGTNGSGAIVQSVGKGDLFGAGTNVATITLAALANANNASYMAVDWQTGGAPTVSAGSGFTLTGQGNDAQGVCGAEYQVPGVTSCVMNCTGSDSFAGYALEISVPATVTAAAPVATLSLLGVG